MQKSRVLDFDWEQEIESGQFNVGCFFAELWNSTLLIIIATDQRVSFAAKFSKWVGFLDDLSRDNCCVFWPFVVSWYHDSCSKSTILQFPFFYCQMLGKNKTVF